MSSDRELFPYRSPNGVNGVCLIEEISLPDGRTVVICEDPADNPGMSVSESLEVIVPAVCARWKIDH